MNTRTPTSFDYRRQNLDILKTNAQLQSNMPGEYEAEIGALQNFQQSSKRKKSGWEAAIDGLVTGVTAGMQKQKYEKLRGELQIYSDYANSMREKNEWFEKRGQFLEQTTPYAESLYSIANSKMDESTKQQYISDLMKQYQSVNPEAGKYDIVAAPSGADFFIQVDRATGEKKMTPYSSMMTPDGWQDLQKRNLENLKIDIQKQNADAYGRSINSNIDYHDAQIGQMSKVLEVRKEEAGNVTRRLDNEVGKSIEKDYGESLKASRAYLRAYPKIEKIIKDNPGILQSLQKIQWDKDNPGYVDQVIRGFYQKFDSDTADALGSLIKQVNRLSLDVSKGLKRPNMFLEKKGDKSVPNFNMTEKAFLTELDNLAEDERYNETNYLHHIEKRDSTDDKRFYNSYAQQTMGQPQAAPATPQGNGGMVRVQDPSTGLIMQLNPQEAQIAISRGGVKVS